MRAAIVPCLTCILVASAIAEQISSSTRQTEAVNRLGSPQSGPPVQLAAVDELRQRVGYDALEKQYQMLARMPRISVAYGTNGTVRTVMGSTGVYLPNATTLFVVDAPAPRMLDEFGPLVLATGTEELRVTRISDPQVRSESNGVPFRERTVKFKQYIRGLPVIQGGANIGINEDSDEVTAFVAHFLPDRGLPTKPKLTSAQATEKLLAAMRADVRDGPPKVTVSSAAPTLAYAFKKTGDPGTDSGDLVWVISVTRQDSRSAESLEASVSAQTGEVLLLEPKSMQSLNRIGYTLNGAMPLDGQNFPQGLSQLSLQQIMADSQAQQAYTHLDTTYQAYQQAVSRDSMNGTGGPIRFVVHHGSLVWGAQYTYDYLVFGEGGGGYASPATNLDSVSHEFGHGVVSHEAGFAYTDAAVDGGTALHEAFADLSTTLVDVYLHGNPTPGQNITWTMIDHLSITNPNSGFRYWDYPIRAHATYRDWFPQRSFLRRTEGLGGHYLNSTIAGHAFYLLTFGGNHYRSQMFGSGIPIIPVPALGYSKARDFFYNALKDPLMDAATDFFGYRDATVRTAINPADKTAIQKAWEAVGVGHGCTTPPAVPNLNLQTFYCHGMYSLDWNVVPGATKYNAQIANSWGWAFANTIVDANIQSCMQYFLQQVMVRIRACNGCGCSVWSQPQDAPYYPVCL